MSQICCFAGHAAIANPKNIEQTLCDIIEKLIIHENVNEFWVGNYGDFDRLSALCVQKMKKQYPGIKLVLVIPYLTDKMKGNPEYYRKMFDEILMANIPERTPRQLRIIACNQFMIDECAWLICYVRHSGGAEKTLDYAKKCQTIQVLEI